MAYYRGITNVVHLQLYKNNYFNIAKARREKQEKQRKARCCVDLAQPGNTSAQEDAVDA